jgi:hypothetical protein
LNGFDGFPLARVCHIRSMSMGWQVVIAVVVCEEEDSSLVALRGMNTEVACFSLSSIGFDLWP